MKQRTIAASGTRRARSTAAVIGASVLASLAVAAPASASGGLVRAALEPLAPPEVTNVVPASGPTSGGETIVVGGKNLTGASAVDFGSTPASFTVKTATKIEAIAPPGTEGTVDVTVATPEGTSAVSRADHFSYLPPGPYVIEVNPDEGKGEGGRQVKILGAHFEGVTSVTFGSEAAQSFEVVWPEGIEATTPQASGPTVDVRVSTAEATSPITPGDEYTYRIAPIEIGRVTANKGPAAGGQTVNLSGLEFYGVEAVEFGSARTTDFTRNSSTSITVVSPPQTAEKVAVSLATSFGPSEPEFCTRNKFSRKGPCVVRDYYKYLEPTVAGATPGAGPLAGGTEVTLNGSGFGVEPGETEVLFGKTPATSVACSSVTTCTALAPPGAKAGTVPLKVTIHSNEPKSSKKSAAATFRYE